MPMYYHVQGWLRCDEVQLKQVKNIIQTTNSALEKKKYYDEGWFFPTPSRLWMAYVFFGSEFKNDALIYFENIIGSLLKEIPDIDGSFFFDHEDSHRSFIVTISDGKQIQKDLDIFDF